MSRNTELAVVESSELPARAAELIARLIREAARSSELAVSVALAGGSTPRAMHERLALVPGVPWERVAIFFGDERCVPPDSPDSNFRMARESLLDRVPIAPEQVHRMRGEVSDRELAARDYEAVLPAELDILILGIGEDGHTLSLFPGADSLEERERRVMAVVGPKPPPERLTLTARAVGAARNVVMLASGAGKAGPVQRALEGEWSPRETPAQLARAGYWFVDPDAASALNAR
jgi:6-phosphogluconolactonase